MNPFVCRLFTASLLAAPTAQLAAQLGAQSTGVQHESSTRIHSAWLCEVLDLDLDGAVQQYQAIARDQRPANVGRWIAVARLTELERAGVVVDPKPSAAEAPAAIRKEFAAAQPIPVAELLARASGDPDRFLLDAGTEAGRMPALRPLTQNVVQVVRDQIGPSRSDRDRQRYRLQTQMRPRQDNRNPDPSNANYILSVELQNRQENAAALRSLFFPDWKPPVVSGDAATTLARVRANLDAMDKERDKDPNERDPINEPQRLRRLREAIELRAATDPAAAVAFVARLPLYAERLLAEPQPNR